MKAAPGAGLGDWIYSYFVWGKEFTAARPSCVQYLDLYLLRLEHIIHTYVCVAHFAGLSQEKFQVSRNSVSRFVLAHHYILTIVIIHECVYNLTYSRCGLWFGVLNFLRRWGQGRGNIFDSLTPSEVPEGSSGDVRASHSTSCAGGESSFLQLRFE